MEEERHRFLGRWLLQVGTLMAVALVVFFGFYSVDHFAPNWYRMENQTNMVE